MQSPAMTNRLGTLPLRTWSFVIGAWLLYGSTARVLNFRSFERVIHEHEVIPALLVPLAGGIVLVWEWLTGAVCVAIAFAGQRLVVASLALVPLLLTLSAYLVAVVLAQGAEASCGCGPAADTGARAGLIRNALLLVIPCGHVAVAASTRRAQPAAPGTDPPGSTDRRP